MTQRHAESTRSGAPRQVAITGLGIVSCIGSTLDEVTASLRAGRSGIAVDDERRKAGFRSALAGRIAGFDEGRRGWSLKMLRSMGEPARYALAAASDAVEDAGLLPAQLESERCGVIFGNDSCAKPAVESVDVVRNEGATHFIGGSHIFKTMNSTVTMNVAAVLRVKGANWTVSAACASGAHSLGQAAMLIRAGLQDIVIAGGAQEMSWEVMASFDALGCFSTRESDPAGASRPFDVDRDGLVPSGGAAALVLEDLEHALARGARVYGIVRGYGFSSDGAGQLSKPESGGAVRAMRMALRDARLDAAEIDYVNAHATSTPVGDRVEAEAIAEVFGTTVPVSSTKSMTGHECWMAGASEALYTALMAKGGFIAPNVNFSRLDEGCPRINVIARTVSRDIGVAVSNSLGFGGTNAALVLDFRDARGGS
jgi:3-oxoacyl-[acyl-carrier-protein] synthase I